MGSHARLRDRLIGKGCRQHIARRSRIRGPLSIPFRVFGVKISRMNPNLCTVCETMLLAGEWREAGDRPGDGPLRGPSRLHLARGGCHPRADVTVDMLDAFHDECAEAIWERDGMVNKFLGDAMLAIFNFPLHARRSREPRRRLAGHPAAMGANDALPASRRRCRRSVSASVSIRDCASIGELGTACKDFTDHRPGGEHGGANGWAMAGAGSILASADVYTDGSRTSCLPPPWSFSSRASTGR